MTDARKRENWVDLLKLIACILITNSHCREIYPWYFLATGGGFGNALFFGISGYLLAKVKGSFGEWYIRRVKRILVPVVILAVFDAVILQHVGDFMVESWLDSAMYYPSKWWFVTAIMIYYLGFYFVAKYACEIKTFLIWLVGYFTIYIIWVDKTTFSVELGGLKLFKVYFYFGVMLVGAILRKNRNAISTKMLDYRGKLILQMLLVTAVFVWGLVYGLITVFGIGYQMQFLIQMSVLVFAAASMMLAWGMNVTSNDIVKVVSAATLEIYLVQSMVTQAVSNFLFPINWLLFFGIAFMGGIAYHCLLKGVENRIRRIFRIG